jgi:hypothetical protein
MDCLDSGESPLEPFAPAVCKIPVAWNALTDRKMTILTAKAQSTGTRSGGDDRMDAGARPHDEFVMWRSAPCMGRTRTVKALAKEPSWQADHPVFHNQRAMPPTDGILEGKPRRLARGLADPAAGEAQVR